MHTIVSALSLDDDKRLELSRFGASLADARYTGSGRSSSVYLIKLGWLSGYQLSLEHKSRRDGRDHP